MHRTVDVLAAAPHREHQHVAARVKPRFGEPTVPLLVLAGLEPRKKNTATFHEILVVKSLGVKDY